MNTFLMLSFFSFLLISVIWGKSDFLNLITKCFFTGMLIFNGFLLLQINGYIVKTVETVEVEQECSRNFMGQEVCKPVVKEKK